MDTEDPILLDIRDSAAIIRFNRPAARNSLTHDIQARLEVMVHALTSRMDITALIFTGTDNVFLSGANIRELATLDPKEALLFAEKGQRLFRAIADAKQTTVAAINGYCMGGGLDLALACDLRVAAPAAEFAHPGAQLGIITGWGGTQRLPRLIGKSQAIEFFITALRLSAAEALESGLVHALDPSPLQYALDTCRLQKDR